MKVTLNARVPYAILAEDDVVCTAPVDMLQSGYGDIVGKYSCLNDWKLAALINGDADIAALPTNAAANLYNKTGGKVAILAVNTLGCLYLMNNTGVAVTSIADLKGKTVYVPAQNPTFIFTYLCRQNGLVVGEDVIIDSTTYSTPALLRDAVAAGEVDYAVLPEPMVTIAQNAAAQANAPQK